MMAITITGEHVLLESDVYDVLCRRAEQAARYEKVMTLLGEVIDYNGWEDVSNPDAKEAFKRLREVFMNL